MRYYISANEYENITAEDAIARLEKALYAVAQAVGKELTQEQVQEAILATFSDCRSNTFAEYNEARAHYGLEPELSPSEKARQENQKTHDRFWVEKPQPSPNHYRCQKCDGTGKFVLYFENGRPKSNTGYECYSCGGAGWKLRKGK